MILQPRGDQADNARMPIGAGGDDDGRAIAAGKLPFLTVEGIVPMQGGLPVIVEDKVIGAVGVSGVTSAQDEQVAQAALRALGG